MSGSKLNYYGSSSITVTNLIEVLDADRMAKFDSISLTNVSTTSVPAIEAASVCEIGGSVYRFSTEEPISTSNIASTSATDWYIDLVPSSSIVTAEFSTIAPTWRSDYQAYYRNSTSIYRTIARTYFDGTNYNDKMMLMKKGGFELSDGNLYIQDQLSVGRNDVKGTRGKTHIAYGTNADTNWEAYAPLVVENNSVCYINVRSPNNSYGGLIFSDPDSTLGYSGLLFYSHITDSLDMYVGSAAKTRLNATGLYVGGAANPSYTIHVNGNGYISSYFYVTGNVYTSQYMYVKSGIYSSGFVRASSNVESSGSMYATGNIESSGSMYATGNIESSGYMRSADGKKVSGSLHSTTLTDSEIWNVINALCPSTAASDQVVVSGGTSAGGVDIIFSKILRFTSTRMQVYGVEVGGVVTAITLDGSTAVTYNHFSMSW